MTTQTCNLSIPGMTCSGCVATIQRALTTIPGVESTSANLSEHTFEVTGNVDIDKVIESITSAGYHATELYSIQE